MLSAREFKEAFIDNWQPTPLCEIDGIFFKNEHKNPTDSIKARGLSWQIYKLLETGISEAVISSSGNAALAASYYAQKAGIKMYVFVPSSLSPEKIEMLNEYGAIIDLSGNAIKKAEEFARKNNVALIRQSIDPNATDGFMRLAGELNEQLEESNVQLEAVSIFFPVSSGTTVVGYWQGLEALALRSNPPQIHIAQTRAVHIIAGEFDHVDRRKARSIVPGIVARSTENTRKSDVVNIVKKSHGWGWIVPDTDIKRAHDWLQHNGIEGCSLEGALALASYWKAKQNYELKTNIVIILT